MKATTDIDEGLRSSSWEGFTGFPIKAKDTEKNQMIHTAFKDFCREQTDNNYTRGLEYLLEYWQGDMKYETIWEEIKQMKILIEELQQKIEKPKQEEKEDEGRF